MKMMKTWTAQNIFSFRFLFSLFVFKQARKKKKQKKNQQTESGSFQQELTTVIQQQKYIDRGRVQYKQVITQEPMGYLPPFQ